MKKETKTPDDDWEIILKKKLKEGQGLKSLSWHSLEGYISPFYTKNIVQTFPENQNSSNWLAISDDFPSGSLWKKEAVIIKKSAKKNYNKEQTLFASCYDDFSFYKNQNSVFLLEDPLIDLAKKGNWNISEKEDLKALEEKLNNNPTERVLMIDASLFQNAGATIVSQISFVLLEIKEYVELYGESIFNQIFIRTAQGSNFYFEIAKIKALYFLVSKLAKAYGISDYKPYIIAEDSLRDKSVLDAENNLIRSTYGTLSGIFGGVDAIYIHPFDLLKNNGNDFSKELSYKQMIILRKESYLSHYINPTEGSYYLNNLIEKFVSKSWEQFLKLEKKGGFIKLLKDGSIGNLVKVGASKEQDLYDQKKIKHIGVNTFPKKEKTILVDKKSPANLTTIFEAIKPKRLAEKIELKNKNGQ